MSEKSKSIWDLFMILRLRFDKKYPGYVFWMADEIARERYVIYCKDKNTLRKGSKVLTYNEMSGSDEGFTSGKIDSAMYSLMKQVELMEDPLSFPQVFEKMATAKEVTHPGLDMKLEALDFPFKYKIIFKYGDLKSVTHIGLEYLIDMQEKYEDYLNHLVCTEMTNFVKRSMRGWK